MLSTRWSDLFIRRYRYPCLSNPAVPRPVPILSSIHCDNPGTTPGLHSTGAGLSALFSVKVPATTPRDTLHSFLLAMTTFFCLHEARLGGAMLAGCQTASPELSRGFATTSPSSSLIHFILDGETHSAFSKSHSYGLYCFTCWFWALLGFGVRSFCGWGSAKNAFLFRLLTSGLHSLLAAASTSTGRSFLPSFT